MVVTYIFFYQVVVHFTLPVNVACSPVSSCKLYCYICCTLSCDGNTCEVANLYTVGEGKCSYMYVVPGVSRKDFIKGTKRGCV